MADLQLEEVGILGIVLMTGGCFGIVPETVQRALLNAWCPSSHGALEARFSGTYDAIGIAAVLVDQSTTRGGVEEVLAEGVVAENLYQRPMQTTTDRDDRPFGLVVEDATGAQELILLRKLSVPEGLVDPGQGLDDVRVFQIGLAVVISLDDTELGNRLAVDVGRQVAEATCRAQELVLVAA